MNEQHLIDIGAVVRDNLGREGIVLSREKAPPQEWIDEQIDADEVRKLGTMVNWWGVMPFDGGYLLCPEPMLTWLRVATYEDFVMVADHAGVEGRLSLVKVFPHYVNLLLEKRQNGKT